jgi:hypothetical protein
METERRATIIMRTSQQQPTAPSLVSIDWHGVLGGILFFVLFTAVGPLTLLLGWLLRAWCRRNTFDAHDRWDSVRAFAWCFGFLLALTLAVAVFAFIAFPDRALFLWTRSPLHFLGAPDLLDNLFLRWVASVPLAFTIALAMGGRETRPVPLLARVPTEREQQQLAEQRQRAEEEQARRAERAERERARRMARAAKPTTPPQAEPSRGTLTTSASPPPKTASRPTNPPVQPGAPPSPATGQGKPALWDELPANHPWKQLARQEQTQLLPSDQVIPPAQPTLPKKERQKPPDLGDGSMDALL